MTPIPNILQSDIVPTAYDAFWDNNNAILNTIEADHEVLVITKAYEPGSAEDTVITNIMTRACKLTDNQYKIIQMKGGEKTAWYQLREKAHPKVVLLIDIHPADLGISALFRLNEPNRFDNIIWIPTFSVAEMELRKELKTQLNENALKPVFIDKTIS